MKDNYLKIIRKLKLFKYRNSPIYNKHFLKDYFLSRKLLLKKKISLKEQIIINGDQTYNLLIKIEKKKINQKDKNYLISLYKKFEINIKLKKRYNSFGKKESNIETSFLSYLVLARLLYKNKLLNNLKFLNFLLKVLDLISLKKKVTLDFKNYNLLDQIINLEKKLVKNYVK